jgi:hypothetical protein
VYHARAEVEFMLQILFYAFWIVPALVLAFLSVATFRRKLHRRYPFFFAYLVFQVVSFMVEFSVWHLWPKAYFRTYWPTTTLSILLSFAVIYEVFREIFDPFDGLRDLGGVLFRWASVVLVLAAVLIALTTNAPGTIETRLVISLERSVRVMQCGIVLLMILCAPCVGLKRQHRIFGIAAGFGIIAAIDLISTAIVANLGVSSTTTLLNSVAHMISFSMAAGIWANYMLTPEPARAPVLQHAPSERWNFALSTAMHPELSAPSLPLIMGAVDRTFEKLSTRQRIGPTHSDQ